MPRSYVLVALASVLIAHAGPSRAGNNIETGSRPAAAPLPAGSALESDGPSLLAPPADEGAFGLSDADIRYFAGQAWSSAQSPYMAELPARAATVAQTTPPDLPPSESPLPEPVSFGVLAVGLAGLYSLRRPKKH
jgi:hypothetical protein